MAYHQMRTDGGYPKGPPREHIRDMSRMVIGPIHRSEGLVGRYPRGHLRDPGVQIWRSSNPEVMKSEVMKSEVVDLDTGIPKHSKRETNHQMAASRNPRSASTRNAYSGARLGIWRIGAFWVCCTS